MLSFFNEAMPKLFIFMLWVTRTPTVFTPHKYSAIYTIGLFLQAESCEDLNVLMDIKLILNEMHVIHGKDSATQLYYKIH